MKSAFINLTRPTNVFYGKICDSNIQSLNTDCFFFRG